MSNYLDLNKDSDCLCNCIGLRIDETTFFLSDSQKNSLVLYTLRQWNNLSDIYMF